MKAGSAFCYFSPIKPGFLAQEEATTARELVTQVLYPEWDIIGSYNINFVNWGIAHQCEDPVKAMQFLNFAFTNGEFNDLLNFGIEGKHYAKMDGSDVMITYPEGVDATNCGYHLAMAGLTPTSSSDLYGKATPKTYGSSIKTATLLLSGPRLTALSPIPPLPTLPTCRPL